MVNQPYSKLKEGPEAITENSQHSYMEKLEKENKDLKQRNEALENAVIALVDLWAGTEKHRWESLEGDPSDELKDVLIMKWPQVQGLANNNLLRKVAALPFDSKKLIPALKELIGDES